MVTLARELKDSPGLQAKFTGRVTLLPETTLSLGKTDRQAVASGRKLNLRRDLCWVAKRTLKFPRKYTQVAEKNILS